MGRERGVQPGREVAGGGGQDGTVQLWDASTGREFRTLEGHKAGAVVRGLSFSPSGKQLADGSVDGTVKVWDVESGREVLALKVGGMLFDVAFSPDGKRLAACSHEARVSEWDVASGRETHSLTALADRQTANSLTPEPFLQLCLCRGVSSRRQATRGGQFRRARAGVGPHPGP